MAVSDPSSAKINNSRQPARIKNYIRQTVIANVEQSVDWYSRLLGATKGSPWDVENTFRLLKIGNIEFCFQKGDEKNPVSTGGAIPYWTVEDFEKARGLAEELGATLYRGPIQIENTNRWMGQMRDPFGCIFGFEGIIP